MTIGELLTDYNLEKSVLIGYYGGGNYGDELLLEVLQNLCVQVGIRQLTVGYQNPAEYGTFHHDFGYPRIDMRDRRAVFRAIVKHKRIIVGGGGLWGLDFNLSVFLLSLLLFASRWLFGKKVYLVGVGYYNSTTKLGRYGALFAAKAANVIIARDRETYDNFHKLNPRHTYLDSDIAWYIKQLDLDGYRADVDKLNKQLHVDDKTLFIALRRFQAKHRNNFTNLVGKFLENNQDKRIIVAPLEPEHVDPAHHRLVRGWKKRYGNVQVMQSPGNPLALYMFFRKYHAQLALVAPQFHAILTAHLAGVPFLPVAYDNKVVELLKRIGKDVLPIDSLDDTEITAFTDNFYRGAADA